MFQVLTTNNSSVLVILMPKFLGLDFCVQIHRCTLRDVNFQSTKKMKTGSSRLLFCCFVLKDFNNSYYCFL